MPYFKAVFNTNRPIEEKAPEERDIHTKMSSNALFSDPPVPYTDFLGAIEEQAKAVDNAQFGGIERIATMRSKEKAVDNIVRKYRDYVSEVADGDTIIILSSGFRHTKPRTSAGEMPKIEGVKNLNSELSGGLKLKWNPVRNVGFYEVQVREVDSVNPKPEPAIPPKENEEETPDTTQVVVEKEWLSYSTRPARIEITGLTPLKYYEVRVRANGTKGFGSFSDIVVMVVT